MLNTLLWALVYLMAALYFGTILLLSGVWWVGQGVKWGWERLRGERENDSL